MSMRRREFIAGSAALTFIGAAQAQVQDLNDAINKAGRQRMLSQRCAKAYLALGLDLADSGARQVLDASLALFDRQLVELKAFAPSPAIKATYQELETVWTEYKAALVGTKPARERVASLIDLDARVLALAHKGTGQYEAASGKPQGKLVNIAGRQRMLSQRCAKFYLALSWDAAVHDAKPELDKARGEFVAAHRVLFEAPEATAAIRAELDLAQNQWVFFENALQLGNTAGQGPRRASEVFRASENVLQVMDRVTGMYARLNVAA
jgi:hypothetical protein